MTIGIEEKDGSFEEKLHKFEKLLRSHATQNEVRFFLSRQVVDFKKFLKSIQSTEPEDGFLAIQAHAQELEWFEQAYKAFDEHQYSVACKYFDLCAQSSNPNAMLILAHMFGSQKYQLKNIEQSINWYNQAANLGDPFALRSLGILYYEGLEVQRDFETALNYFLQASKKSDAESMYYLGEMYNDGTVVKKDKERAKKYFEQAARNGHKKAIVKMQSWQEVVEKEPAPEFEVKSAPVQFVPMNALGEGSMPPTHIPAAAREAFAGPRIKKPSKRRQDSSNSLFKIAMVATIITVVTMFYFADNLGFLSRKGKLLKINQRGTVERSLMMKFKPAKGKFGGIKMWCSLSDSMLKDQLYNRNSEAAVICNFGKAANVAQLASAFTMLEKYRKGHITKMKIATGGNFKVLASWCSAKPSRRAALTHSKKDEKYVCGFRNLSKIKDLYNHFSKFQDSF